MYPVSIAKLTVNQGTVDRWPVTTRRVALICLLTLALGTAGYFTRSVGTGVLVLVMVAIFLGLRSASRGQQPDRLDKRGKGRRPPHIAGLSSHLRRDIGIDDAHCRGQNHWDDPLQIEIRKLG